MSYRPPSSAPGDRSHLERMVQALSVERSIAADRLRRWVSTMVLLGALERAGDDGHRFLLKGGVAIELRLRLRARATKDVDLIVVCEQREELIEVLRDALEQPYLDFTFRVSYPQQARSHQAPEPPPPMPVLTPLLIGVP